MKKLTTEEFIERAVKIHGEKYSYKNTIYTKASAMITYLCPAHGEVTQKANNHLNGKGCKFCDPSLKKTTKSFINDARKVHGDTYDYSEIIYKNSKAPVRIICKKHGPFMQTRNNHITLGQRCPMCFGNKRKSTKEFVKDCIDKHGDRYDYSKVEYKNKNSKIKIICKIHGEFLQVAGNHLNSGYGCNQCGVDLTATKRTHTTEQFIESAKKIHGDLYEYNNVDYVNNRDKIIITCKKHGNFFQPPDSHLAGKGCRKCGNVMSKPELELVEYIKSLGVGVDSNNRQLIAPYEIDIFIPELNIAIEFCGLYWHCEKFKNSKYHENKYILCKNKDIRLITLFEDEWMKNKELVKNKIRSILKKDIDKSVYARKCTVIELTNQQKKIFLNTNHIQGTAPSSIAYGLVYEDQIVACMTFSKYEYSYTLNRFATSVRIPGGFSKLLKYFKGNNKWEKIISFADLRWSEGDLYEKNGWVCESRLKPDYFYIKGPDRLHKFGFRHKLLKNKLDNYDPSLTEHVNCNNNNYFRIYDCGKLRYELRNEKWLP